MVYIVKFGFFVWEKDAMSLSPSQIHYIFTVKNVSQNQNVTLTFVKKLCT